MCIQTAIQNKIAELTNDGEDIAVFLAEVLRGTDPTVKTHHRLEAARMLSKYRAVQPEGKLIPFNPTDSNTHSPSEEVSAEDNESPLSPRERARVRGTQQTPSPSMGEGRDGGEDSAHFAQDQPLSQEEHRNEDEQDEHPPHPVSPVKPRPTLRDIVAYPLARYIRDRTGDGETLIYSLKYLMEGGHYNPDPFTGMPRTTVKPHEKLSAAKELMRRAMGEHSSPRRASDAYDPEVELDANDPINSAIAKLVREHTNNGVEAAEVLIRVVESDPRDGEWQSSHRLSAAKELFHRAYDLNYDAVTWKDYEDYYRASEEYNEAYEIGRARRKAEISAILEEYGEASASGDEEAMAAVEEKYKAYLRAEKGEEIEYAEYGPTDPDPTPMYPVRKPWRRLSRKSGRHSAAADIRLPSLTIPLQNKSLPP